jgi:hypothetical protein
MEDIKINTLFGLIATYSTGRSVSHSAIGLPFTEGFETLQILN